MDKKIKHYEEIVKQPGKFEGQPRFIPYFYNLMLGGEGTTATELVTEIEITSEDVKLFPELKGYDKVVLYVDNDRFVYGDVE